MSMSTHRTLCKIEDLVGSLKKQHHDPIMGSRSALTETGLLTRKLKFLLTPLQIHIDKKVSPSRKKEPPSK